MRNAGFGLLAGIVIATLVLAEFPQAQARRAAPPTSAGDLIALPFDGNDGKQQVTIVDPRTRVMVVYQVEKGTGSLALRSVRNVQWDLIMEEYNTSHGTPTPREIRALAEQR